jgi:multicomponent Na+:H+ antiporter subunit E
VFATKATQRTETGRTTYANSITLTPGTVTLSTTPDGDFEIHVITDAARRDVETLSMDRRCSALEGKLKASGDKA